VDKTLSKELIRVGKKKPKNDANLTQKGKNNIQAGGNIYVINPTNPPERPKPKPKPKVFLIVLSIIFGCGCIGLGFTFFADLWPFNNSGYVLPTTPEYTSTTPVPTTTPIPTTTPEPPPAIVWVEEGVQWQDSLLGIGTFVGYWCTVHNRPHGRGTITWPHGIYDREYYGYFYNGFRHGRGRLIWNNDSVYYGPFEWGRESGIDGYMRWYEHGALVEWYRGDWSQRRPFGIGTRGWPSGIEITGTWRGNELIGEGTETDAYGRSRAVVQVNGRFEVAP